MVSDPSSGLGGYAQSLAIEGKVESHEMDVRMPDQYVLFSKRRRSSVISQRRQLLLLRYGVWNV